MTQENTKDAANEQSGERGDDADALFVLGTRYSNGRDVEHDLIAAHKWFNLAAMMGHEEARLSRAELAREMTSAQIAEAQRHAREWLWMKAKGAVQTDTAAAPAVLSERARAAPGAQPALRIVSKLCA